MSRGAKTITRHGVTTDRRCLQPKGKGPNGRGLCRWCHQEVAPRRSTFCSSKCVDEYRMECDPARLRWLTGKRDKGVCAECGRDTTIAKRIWNRIRRVCGWMVHDELARQVGWPTDPARDWWDADHVHPVIRGGPNHIDNMRTLCVPCHKAATARLAAERAAERRADKASLFAGATT